MNFFLSSLILIRFIMTYLSNRVSSGGYCGGCSKTCSPCKSTQTNLETAISSSYANPTNTPISHSISAQKSLDTLTYSNNSSNSSGYFIFNQLR